MSGSDDAEARAIAADNPGWQAWRGVGVTGWYARRPRSSPPIVVKAPTPDALRDAIGGWRPR